jgi:hypothetical protein
LYKSLTIVLYFLAICCTHSLFAGEYEQTKVFKQFGEKIAPFIATFAHTPAEADYISSEVNVISSKKICISTTFKSKWSDDNLYMDVILSVDNDGNPESFYVKKDTASMPPFTTVLLIKKAVISLLSDNKEDSDPVVRDQKRKFYEELDSLDGKDFCAIFLTLQWIIGGYKRDWVNAE